MTEIDDTPAQCMLNSLIEDKAGTPWCSTLQAHHGLPRNLWARLRTFDITVYLDGHEIKDCFFFAFLGKPDLVQTEDALTAVGIGFVGSYARDADGNHMVRDCDIARRYFVSSREMHVVFTRHMEPHKTPAPKLDGETANDLCGALCR